MEASEAVDWTPTIDAKVEWIKGKRGSDLLLSGDVDAIIHPHPPRELLEACVSIRRLFDNPFMESKRYYDKVGYFPIMHIMAFQTEVVRREPDLPRIVMNMWDDAKEQAARYYEDPGYSEIAFARRLRRFRPRFEYENSAVSRFAARTKHSGLGATQNYRLPDCGTENATRHENK